MAPGMMGENIKMTERQLQALAEQTPAVEHLQSIPGIGLLTATALVAFIGQIQRFSSERRFASYLGLTPREFSSGLKWRLGRISKRGDAYLRMLLIHGARSILCHAKRAKQHDRLRSWVLALEKRTWHNTAAVALANKLARIAWAVWKCDRDYVSTREAADTFAVDLPPSPDPCSRAGCHGATVASRPFGRLRRCASRSLDPAYAPRPLARTRRRRSLRRFDDVTDERRPMN